MSQKIPLLNLQEQHRQIGSELEQAVLSVLRSGSYILGQYGAKLETEIAALCGCKYGIGVANGTDALHLALWALDVGAGDEVITSPFTFAATVEAIMMRNAVPVFADVDNRTFNLDPNKIEKLITSRTKVLLPVHLYGQPADMDPLIALADRYKLKIIEDNAQAIGATYKGRPTGSLGDIACISFYPTKNLGACGDAGMIVTDDENVAERLKTIRAHGMKNRYFHHELGVNSRLDEIQAVALLTKLKHLKEWNKKRREIAYLYSSLLQDCKGITTPVDLSFNNQTSPTDEFSHVWHQYTIRINPKTQLPRRNNAMNARDYVAHELAERGIASMCYYPVPLHLQNAFAALGYRRGDFPISESLAEEVLSLPIYPELSTEQVRSVSESLLATMSGQQALAPQNIVQPAFTAQ
jgi:dTDP-4-amino-4,6-dideoxygalactose transaminase